MLQDTEKDSKMILLTLYVLFELGIKRDMYFCDGNNRSLHIKLIICEIRVNVNLFVSLSSPNGPPMLSPITIITIIVDYNLLYCQFILNLMYVVMYYVFD